MNVCFTSVGCRERYTPYLDRLEASLKRFAPNIPRLFFRDCWPPNSPTHMDSHYAFKAWALKSVYMAGFDIGIWLDAACEVLRDPEQIVAEILNSGYYITSGGEKLGLWINDQALDHFGYTRDGAMELSLCGGAIVGLNFKSGFGWSFLQEWLKLSEKGLFYTSHSEHAPGSMTSLQVSDGPTKAVQSKDPRFLGHRADEACFSLMLDQCGLKPFDNAKHFTHAAMPNLKAIIKTGYDL